jgi:prepilin-type N-terminal cleavage/methylation domain
MGILFNAFRTSLVAKRAELAKDDKGFTLIELLVVVLIIGILTAIAVPVFIGQQNQAKDAAAKSDLGVAKVALISYYTANPTGTPTAANLASFGYTPSAGVGTIDLTGVTSSTNFCIDVVSETGTSFKIEEDTAVAQGTCA